MYFSTLYNIRQSNIVKLRYDISGEIVPWVRYLWWNRTHWSWVRFLLGTISPGYDFSWHQIQKSLTSKLTFFYPIEYRRRIRNYMTWKMKVKVILNQWHLKAIEWSSSDSLWICESNRRSICNFTRPWLYLPLSICINCRALALEGGICV